MLRQKITSTTLPPMTTCHAVKETATKILITFVLFHSIAFADNQASSTCLRNGVERIVQLRVDNPSGVPCQVVYLRTSEQIPEKRLWFAEVDANYCKAKYDAFLEKLQTKLNWSCSTDNAASDQASDLTTTKNSELPSESISAPQQKPIKLVEVMDAKRPRAIPEPQTKDIPRVIPEPQAKDVARTSPELQVEKTEPPEKPQIQSARLSENATRVIARNRIESSNSSATVEPLRQTEPEFQAALPAELAVSTLQSRLATPTVLSKDTLDKYFPSGFYAMDSSQPHLGATGSCPAPGYYVWNTQNPQKPVFELGPVWEFEVNIADMNSVLETPILALPIGSVDEQTNCSTRVSFSACQYPDYREGASRWNSNNQSFDCRSTNTSVRNPIVHLALFQNRDRVKSDTACNSDQQITHMALAAVSQHTQLVSEQSPTQIELAISSVAGNIHTRCRYIRSSSQ